MTFWTFSREYFRPLYPFASIQFDCVIEDFLSTFYLLSLQVSILWFFFFPLYEDLMPYIESTLGGIVYKYNYGGVAPFMSYHGYVNTWLDDRRILHM